MVTLSSSGLPVLWNIVAFVTVPVAVSTLTTQIPLPLRLRRFASYVYSGNGAVIAMDWATESDTGTGAEMLAASDCTAGRGRFLRSEERRVGKEWSSRGSRSSVDASR